MKSRSHLVCDVIYLYIYYTIKIIFLSASLMYLCVSVYVHVCVFVWCLCLCMYTPAHSEEVIINTNKMLMKTVHSIKRH